LAGEEEPGQQTTVVSIRRSLLDTCDVDARTAAI
jgi:hypothetical protein